MIPAIAIQDARRYSKEYNLYCGIESRIKNLKFHAKNLESYDSDIYALHMRFIEKMRTQLDNNSTTAHTPVSRKYKKLGTAQQHMRKVFDGQYLRPSSKGLSALEIIFLEKMKRRGNLARQGELRWRLEVAIKEANRANWYIVFQTLTCAPGQIRMVFEPESSAWKDYIQSVDRAVATAAYGSIRKAKGQNYHNYFAVVERGAKRGRLHIHVVHMMKILPDKMRRDPNLKTKIPNQTCIRGFQQFWQHGTIAPKAVRFGANDRYTKDGWKWPFEKKNDQWIPIKACTAGQLAGYLSKYIQKAYQLKKKGNFRCRMTRGLGLMNVKAIMQYATIDALLTMVSMRDNAPMRATKQKPPPMRIVRTEATREMMIRLNSSMKWTYLRALTPQPPLIRQLRTMIQKNQYTSWPNIILTSIQKSKNTAIFEQIKKLWRSSNARTSTRLSPSGPGYIAGRSAA